jgi:RNA polymerase sigma-70 factor (ECF subfamily)
MTAAMSSSAGDPRQLEDATRAFERERPRLRRVAYRLLGNTADAEDAVADVCLRWLQLDRDDLRSPAAYLTTMVSHAALDRLRAQAVARASYPGVWLPDPGWSRASAPDEHGAAAPPDELADVPYALMVAMDRLPPSERVAFVLHDLFDVDYAQLSDLLEREPAAVRQLVKRARANVSDSTRGQHPTRAQRTAWVERFAQAAASGDLGALAAMLKEDVVTIADGGGKRAAALNPIVGRDHTFRYFLGLASKRDPVANGLRVMQVVDDVGFFMRDPDGGVTVMMVGFDGDQARALFVVRNPDKLSGTGAGS